MELINLIGDLGFPIIVSVALFYQMNKTNEQYLGILKDFQSVITNNTHSINLLNSTVATLERRMKEGE